MYLLGYEIGSTSVKASLVDTERGECVAKKSAQAGWTEQDPENWWDNLILATKEVLEASGIHGADVAAIGISYQMHGLILVDKNQELLRPCIIGSDTRAETLGEKAFCDLGEDWCLSHLLNSPGNFTASKLAWVKHNEPELYAKIDKVMLPGDYIAMKLTGTCSTTVPGLSEGMFWDFRKGRVSDVIMKYYGLSESFIPPINPTFSIQGEVSEFSATLLGLKAGTPVSYRAGDQPTNALSLNVLNPGEIAVTAGDSGFIYGVSGRPGFDPKLRVNSFAHVNHTAGIPGKKTIGPELMRIGVLYGINGVGALNSWLKNNFAQGLSFDEINTLASKSPIGAKGLSIMPFANGNAHKLNQASQKYAMLGIDLNTHGQAEIFRAAQESMAFGFAYGIEIMAERGIKTKLIRAGNTEMFLSPVFRETLTGITGATIELYDTDGSVGAAKGAGVGAGIYKNTEEAFATLREKSVIEPNVKDKEAYLAEYEQWKSLLKV